MKKNILTIIILAISFVNLLLTATMIFVMLPTFSKTNNLITKVSSAINLEMESTGSGSADKGYQVSDLDYSTLAYESKQTFNLKKDPNDNTEHYAIIESVELTYNKKAEGYSEAKKLIDEHPSYVLDIVKDKIKSHTKSDLDEVKLREELIKEINEQYKTKCLVKISLNNFLTS